jgi:hypothetical protein
VCGLQSTENIDALVRIAWNCCTVAMSRSARNANTEQTAAEQAVNNSSNSRRRPPPLNDVDEGEEDDGSTVGEAAGGSSRRRRSSSNNASGSPQKRSSMLDSPGRQVGTIYTETACMPLSWLATVAVSRITASSSLCSCCISRCSTRCAIS